MNIENSFSHPYEQLTPDTVLDAVESLGFVTNGRLLALNSYENRVYQVGIEDQRPLVVKFYRPGRWSNESILEEHQFSRALAESEIPVVPPMTFNAGQDTLLEFNGFRYSVFHSCGGRWPELDNPENLLWIGRFIGRIHALGKARKFQYRPEINVKTYGWESLEFLIENKFIPIELHEAYTSIVNLVLNQVENQFSIASSISYLRIHGDCHPGNILWTDDGPHFVDFDDTRMGPAVQDIWMLLSGDRQSMTSQLSKVLEGYTEFCDFDAMELNLLESLRTLRMIHYSAWLAKRWSDPAFPVNFPWFDSNRYWEEQILNLKEQSSLIDEGALIWH